jgi:predicted Zn-ribbon and HTH transcriptional regulator
MYGISLLYPVILTSISAALLWYADRRRFKLGSCSTCGYDRRGLPADAKCPECGTGTG